MVFESPRLIVRLPQRDDFPYFFGAMSDPEIMRYIRTPIQEESAARERVNGWEKYAEKHPGLGVFVAVLKENGAFAGYCVARHVNFDSEQQEFEIGYTFLKDYWGLGLASELVTPLCHYCFTQTKAPYLVAFTDPENMASQRVLCKNGFELYGQRKVYEGISNEYRLNQVGYSA